MGTAVVKELLGAGHRVLGLARSDKAAEAIAKAGAEVLRGDLEDVASLERGAAESDGVIHTGYIHDFAKIAVSGAVDVVAIDAIGATLAGTNKPFVVTSALGAMTPGKLALESDAADPSSPGAHRLAAERATMALKNKGIRASIVRLAASVHGAGDYAFVPALIKAAREKGESIYIGDGKNRWPAVHRLDAAALYRLALEKGEAGAVFHGVADEGIPLRTIAEVIGRKLNVPVVSKTKEEAATTLTWLTKFAAMDIYASSALTQQALGWKPAHLDLLTDLEQGPYFSEAR